MRFFLFFWPNCLDVVAAAVVESSLHIASIGCFLRGVFFWFLFFFHLFLWFYVSFYHRARAHTHNIFVAISFIPFGVCLTYHAHYFGYFSFLSLIAFANLNAGAACITFLHITTCRVISISSLTLLFFILSLLVYRYVLFRFFCHSTCCPIGTVQCAQYLRYFMLISSYFLVDLPAFKWFPLERFYSIVVRIDHSKHTSTQNSSR